MSSVPVIDISGLDGSGPERQAVARQIGAACEEIGFFCITGHGVSQALIDKVRAASNAFFAQPEAAKAAIMREPPSYRGYIPLASEGLARSLGQAGAAADLKEAFSMGPVDMPADGAHLQPGAAAHFAPNRWPAEPADFQPVFEEYYRAVSAVADKLLGGFALALGLPEGWFADKVDRHISNVRALYYPAQAEAIPPGQIRAGQHTDYGCLTILLTEPQKAGLEVITRGGTWEPVPHVPDSFVVNIGDLMAQWSNDRYVSTMHRVVNPARTQNTGRLSIAFFHQPNHDALIECIPGCAGPDKPVRYEPITSGDHRLMKVSRANAAMASPASQRLRFVARHLHGCRAPSPPPRPSRTRNTMPLLFRRRSALFGAMLAALLPLGVRAQDATPLHTAVDANFPPHAFTRLDGKLDGFQIDLGEAIGKQLKRPVLIEGGNFAGLIPAMNAGRYDFLLAPVTATPERAENMLFTEGYLFTAFQFGIKKGGTPIKSLDDIKGKVIVVNRGSAYDVWARDNAAKYGFTPLVLDTFTDATLAVAQGRAFAQLGGNTSIRYAAQKNPQFVADYVMTDTRSHWSLAVRKGDTAMRNTLENALECLKKDGTLVKLSEKWFGTVPAADDAERVVFPGYGVPGLPGYDPTPHEPRCN